MQQNGRTVTIWSLAVLPTYQRYGLGKTLLRSYQQRISSSGIADRIALLAREDLVGWYEGMGFENRGKSKAKFAGGEWWDLVCLHLILELSLFKFVLHLRFVELSSSHYLCRLISCHRNCWMSHRESPSLCFSSFPICIDVSSRHNLIKHLQRMEDKTTTTESKRKEGKSNKQNILVQQDYTCLTFITFIPSPFFSLSVCLVMVHIFFH